jgi:hypothetical protein
MNCRKTTINLKRHGFCGQVSRWLGDVLLQRLSYGKECNITSPTLPPCQATQESRADPIFPFFVIVI